MKTRLLGAGMGLVSILAAPSWAADFDGTKPLICAVVKAHDCTADAECESGTPKAIGAPTFLRVDVDRKQIVGPQRTTPIKVIEKTEEQILLLGTELGLGWTMALERATGAISVSLVDHDGAFVLFGSCTLP